MVKNPKSRKRTRRKEMTLTELLAPVVVRAVPCLGDEIPKEFNMNHFPHLRPLLDDIQRRVNSSHAVATRAGIPESACLGTTLDSVYKSLEALGEGIRILNTRESAARELFQCLANAPINVSTPAEGIAWKEWVESARRTLRLVQPHWMPAKQ